MVQPCPYCMVLVGKLYLRCEWCGVYFCEDCIKPLKHNCLVYKEGSATKLTHSVPINPYSKEMYEKFANPEDLEDEEPFIELITLQQKTGRDEALIIEGNLIYREQIRLGLGKLNNQCPICHSELNKVNEKCSLCKISFCTYCIEPENHSCVIYQHRNGKFPPLTPKVRVEPEFEPVQQANELTLTTEPLKAEPLNKPVLLVTQNNSMEVREEVQVEKKVSLWKRLLLLFGFN